MNPSPTHSWRVSSSQHADSSSYFGPDSGCNPPAYFSSQRSPNYKRGHNLASTSGNSIIKDKQSFLSPPPPKKTFLSPNQRTFSPTSWSPATTSATVGYMSTGPADNSGFSGTAISTGNTWLHHHLNSQQNDADSYSLENVSEGRQWHSTSPNLSSNNALFHYSATQKRSWQTTSQLETCNLSVKNASLAYNSTENASQNLQWQTSPQNELFNNALPYMANENASQNQQWLTSPQNESSNNTLSCIANKNASPNQQWQTSPQNELSNNTLPFNTKKNASQKQQWLTSPQNEPFVANKNTSLTQHWHQLSTNESSNNASLSYIPSENASRNRSLSRCSLVNTAQHLISSDYETPNRSLLIDESARETFLHRKITPQNREFSSQLDMESGSAVSLVASQNRFEPSRVNTTFANDSDLIESQIPNQFECSLIDSLRSDSNVRKASQSSTALPEVWSQLPPAAQRNDFKASLVRSESRRSISTCGTATLRNPLATSSRKSQFQIPRSGVSSVTRNSSLSRNSVFAETSPGCFVAIVEGRGSARGEIGLASISMSSPTLILCQFSDTRTYMRTLTKLAIFNPSEILIPHTGQMSSGSGDCSKLYDDIGEHCPNASVTQVHRKYFNEARGMQTVKHLCAPEYSSVELQLGHKYYALAAAFALLKYVEFIQNIIYAPKSVKVEFQASANSTMIDVETAKHVELLHSTLNPKSNNSLFGFLNRCSTPGGIRFLRSSLFQPTLQKELIVNRLSAIEELLAKPEVLTGLQSTLSRFCDIDQLLSLCAVVPKQETLSRIEHKINHVIGLKQALELVNPLHKVLSAGVESSLLSDIRIWLQDEAYQVMLAKVQRVIHDEARAQKGTASMKLQRCFSVRGGINGLLDVARRTYCEIIEDIERHVQELSEAHGVALKLGYNSQRGYHVQITSCGKKNQSMLKLTDLPANFLRPQKFKTLITFTTEEIVKLDQRSQDALREVTLMSNVLIVELLTELRETIGSLYKLSEIVSTLDMLVSLTEVSSQPGFVKPSFGESLVIREGRHPILVHMNLGQTGGGLRVGRQKSQPRNVATCATVVANDTVATYESRVHILTGSNMSGKSTYLKQVVLLQVMAQVGCYIPAESGQFRIMDAIFSRIGTSDSIECNASTFMLEMKEMSYILSNMTSQSLIVIDELGRGTSTEEGAAICWAIAEDIIKMAAFAFMATHFHLLTKLENLHATVNNFYFLSEYHDGAVDDAKDVSHERSVQRSHKIARGCGLLKNYGIKFARTTSLPKQVLSRAEQLVENLVDGAESESESSPEEVQHVNCLRLIQRLKILAGKCANEKCLDNETKELFRNLQTQFIQSEDSCEE